MTTSITEVGSPIGPLTLAERGGALIGLATSDHFGLPAARFADDTVTGSAAESVAAAELAAYFDGDLGALDRIRVETAGTEFQEAVWKALREIPPGTTISYAELARQVGRPTGSRAVGQANGANPVWLVNPCHRVIASDGGLGGYGGGLDLKAWLLRHEGIAR